MTRAWRTLVAVAWLAATPTATAQPTPAAVVQAQERHEKGKALFKAKDFAAAAIEFAAAYALDAQPKYLFNLAQAHRFGDRCREAIEAYQAFLATSPADQQDVEFARTGIERCEQDLPPAPPVITCGDGAIAGSEACDDGGTDGGDGCGATCAVETGWTCHGTPSACTAISQPRPPVAARSKDRLGPLLIGVGIGTAAASVTLYLMARSAASDTFDVQSRDDFESSRDRASTLQTLSLVAAGATVGLVTVGVIRLVTRSRPDIAITPTAGGGAVVLGGRF